MNKRHDWPRRATGMTLAALAAVALAWTATPAQAQKKGATIGFVTELVLPELQLVSEVAIAPSSKAAKR